VTSPLRPSDVLVVSTAQIAPVLAALDASAHRPIAITHHPWTPDQHQRAAESISLAIGERRLGAGDLVVFSSGSTGHPRGVIRTLTSWRASLEPLTQIIEASADDHMLIPGSVIGTMNLYAHFHARHLGCRVSTHSSPQRVTDATVLHVLGASAAGWLEYIRQGRAPHLRCVVTAGDRLPDHVLMDFAELGIRVVDYYGAAELSFVGWRGEPGPFVDFPGVQTRVHAKQMWVRSPYLAREPLDQRGSWQMHDDWASVGDRAITAESGWHIQGRGDGAITTGGHTVTVEEIEVGLRELPGVVDVAVVGIPHARLGQQVACVWSGDTTKTALTRAVSSWSPPMRPRRWHQVSVITRTNGGKIDRAAVQRLLTEQQHSNDSDERQEL